MSLNESLHGTQPSSQRVDIVDSPGDTVPQLVLLLDERSSQPPPSGALQRRQQCAAAAPGLQCAANGVTAADGRITWLMTSPRPDLIGFSPTSEDIHCKPYHSDSLRPFVTNVEQFRVLYM